MAALLPAEDGDDSDDELELQGQGTISLKCPILFTDFVKPMRKCVAASAAFLLRAGSRRRDAEMTRGMLTCRAQSALIASSASVYACLADLRSESAITEYWSRGPKPCPSAGCDVLLAVSDWIPDVQLLQSLAKDKVRREARAEASQATQGVQVLDSDDESQVKREVKPQTQAMQIDSDSD